MQPYIFIIFPTLSGLFTSNVINTTVQKLLVSHFSAEPLGCGSFGIILLLFQFIFSCLIVLASIFSRSWLIRVYPLHLGRLIVRFSQLPMGAGTMDSNGTRMLCFYLTTHLSASLWHDFISSIATTASGKIKLAWT